MQKSHYKTQLIYPEPDLEGTEIDGKKVYCHPLGESTSGWEAEKTAPGKEDFAYVVWTKMHLCYDLIGVIKAFIPGAKAAEAAAGAIDMGGIAPQIFDNIEQGAKDIWGGGDAV